MQIKSLVKTPFPKRKTSTRRLIPQAPAASDSKAECIVFSVGRRTENKNAQKEKNWSRNKSMWTLVDLSGSAWHHLSSVFHNHPASLEPSAGCFNCPSAGGTVLEDEKKNGTSAVLSRWTESKYSRTSFQLLTLLFPGLATALAMNCLFLTAGSVVHLLKVGIQLRLF